MLYCISFWLGVIVGAAVTELICGSQDNVTTDINSAVTPMIGQNYTDNLAYSFGGYIDEFRFGKGIARWWGVVHSAGSGVLIENTLRGGIGKMLCDKLIRLFWDLLPDPATVTDFDTGEYIDVNKAFCAAMQLEKEVIIGKNPVAMGILAQSERDKLLTALNYVGSARRLILRYSAGERDWLFSLSADIVEVNGSKCILTVARDVTDEISLRMDKKISHTEFVLMKKQIESISATICGLQKAMNEIFGGNKDGGYSRHGENPGIAPDNDSKAQPGV